MTPTCNHPDHDEPRITCGYPLPCPWHTAVVHADREPATLEIPATADAAWANADVLAALVAVLGSATSEDPSTQPEPRKGATCAHCGGPFRPSARSHARYCSRSCKTMASRRRRRAPRPDYIRIHTGDPADEPVLLAVAPAPEGEL